MTASKTQLLTLLPIGAAPDPAQPTVIPLAATIGGFVGVALAKLRGESGDQVRDAALEGGFRGTAVGIGVYVLALISQGLT